LSRTHEHVHKVVWYVRIIKERTWFAYNSLAFKKFQTRLLVKIVDGVGEYYEMAAEAGNGYSGADANSASNKKIAEDYVDITENYKA